MNLIFWARKIPVLGNLAWLANAYAFGGDRRSRTELAPIRLWLKAFFWNILIACVITLATLHEFTASVVQHLTCGTQVIKTLPGNGPNASATILSIFPNLLGLGIGIYALLYALDATVVRAMHQSLEKARREGTRKHGSVLMLNSDMAFPLCALLLIIALGIVTQFFPTMWLQAISWVAFWYGALLIFELIMLLFALIDNSLLGKLDRSPSAEDANRAAGPPQEGP